jgi:probable F420-dependent oxidoreductase
MRAPAGTESERLRWGVYLPTLDAFRQGTPPLVEAARRAEELGFDTAWAGDHLVFHPPLLESMCALSAAAAVTSRIRLGVGVLLLPLRDIVWAAKQLTTVNALAPGRLTLGVGIGGENPEEFTAAGVPIRERGRRLDEALEILPDLLTGKPVDHSGPLLSVHSPGLEPAPAAPPPLFVGGRSDAAMERVARHGDGWLAMWHRPDTVAARRRALAARAAELGRPEPSTTMLVFVNVADREESAREEAAAMLWGQYRLRFDTVERYTLFGPAARVAERLAAYREAGVAEFALHPAARDPLAQYEAYARVRELLS